MSRSSLGFTRTVRSPAGPVSELVENALSLSNRDVIELVEAQQKITRRHTYVHKIRNLFRAMAEP